MLGDKRLRLNVDKRRRMAAKAKMLGRRILQVIATIVTPGTLLALHRKLIAKKYYGTQHSGHGRPQPRDEIESLIVRMATENRDWGYLMINLNSAVGGGQKGRLRGGCRRGREEMAEDLAQQGRPAGWLG